MDSARGPRRPLAACISIFAATGGIALVSHDTGVILACGSVLALAVGLLWRMGEAPVLLMAAGMQLSQVIALPLYASITGVPVQDVWPHVGDVNLAIWFALAALLSLVVGMWCGHRGARPAGAAMQQEAAAWSPRGAFVFCLATIGLSAVFVTLAAIYVSARQPLLAASRLEWAGVFVLTYVCATQRRGFAYVLLIAFFEFFKGIVGYFADFREIFVVLLVAVVAASPRLRPRMVLTGLLLAGIALSVGAFWSATKTNYRKYLNQGTLEQVVLVPLEERLSYLMDRVAEADGETMQFGFERLVMRWSYVDLLSATMRNVPAQLPFENGALISATILHVLQPRLLFPDKPPLPSDTDVAVRYSGLGLDSGGNAANTSISLGYVAELYVDFGRIGALAAMFVMGFLFGLAIRYLTSWTALPTIVSSGLAVSLMLSAASFDQALPKMVGGTVTTFALILALRIFFLPYLLRMSGPRVAAKFGTALPQRAGRAAAGG